ncbi:MAG TPA: hypothetical protein VFP35_02770 [Candidatus Saccharimonadales bacterium]|nr:hypothetical protein [Candidatus Saccharimonadales bacterium]
MARTETIPVTRASSPYASFMLTLAVILLAAILALMIYGAIRVRNASHTVDNKIDNLTAQIQKINNSINRFNP